MKQIVKIFLIAALGCGLFLIPAHAQITNVSTTPVTAISVERPKAPERTAVTASTDSARQLVEDAKLKAERYLVEQRTLAAAAAKATTEEERAKIRAQIQAKREAFLTAQRDVREEIQKRAVELRDQLKNHREVLDSAKDQVRERVRQRKGGDD